MEYQSKVIKFKLITKNRKSSFTMAVLGSLDRFSQAELGIELRDACVVVLKAWTTISNLGIVLEFFWQTGPSFFDVLLSLIHI